MIFAVDTNILLDILIPNTAYVGSSLNLVTNLGMEHDIIVSDIVYAELASQFHSSTDLEEFLDSTSIGLVSSDRKSLFEASLIWKKYAHRKKDKILCPHCGKKQKIQCDFCRKVISYRQHILSDFLIGAHAKVHAHGLITRDRGFYREYFNGLELVTP